MREVGYYPGCSLEASARDYAESIQGVAELLGIKLVEVADWNCCGATAGHSLDHRATLNLGARNLALAAAGPQPLLVPCALCFNRLKAAQAELAQIDLANVDMVHAASDLVEEVAGLTGDAQAVQVQELNSFLAEPEMAEAIAAGRKRSLEGLRLVCYYGCQGQRPPAVTGHPHPENPMGMDRLLARLGAEVLDWPLKTDCCGASHAVPRPDLVYTLVGRLYQEALRRGAQAIVTGCQMCQANLDLYQAEIAAHLGREVNLPVFYFSELVGLALGHAQAERWLARHMVDPRPLARQQGLLG
jgi:heterodisulfide reductase subunit B